MAHRRGVRIVIYCLLSVFTVALMSTAAWIAWRCWPRTLAFHPRTNFPVCIPTNERCSMQFLNRTLLGEIGTYSDELLAYLNFDFVRSRPLVAGREFFLTVPDNAGNPGYRIEMVLPPDLEEAITLLATLKANSMIPRFDWNVLVDDFRLRREQTRIFEQAYNEPVPRRLRSFDPQKLTGLTARFLYFKSRTDPRILRSLEPVPRPLTRESARELAADIIAVAEFYDIPLDMFLGIGAMENNYMDIRGDLNNTIWKRRPAKDDVILRRRGGRVLVANYSSGVWQITRETLRYVHHLYRKDKRDYSKLPERLRPPAELDLDISNPHVLTTYAGLLLRDLINHFDGDVAKAVGAYNGGRGRPNMRYESGVKAVADYARRILGRAAALSEESVATARYRKGPHSEQNGNTLPSATSQ